MTASSDTERLRTTGCYIVSSTQEGRVPTGKLIALMLGWVLASVMIALVTAIVVVELLRLVGVAESGTSGYTVALNAVFGVVLAVLVAVPFLFRRRFNAYERPPDA
jgi:hypothetical protein